MFKQHRALTASGETKIDDASSDFVPDDTTNLNVHESEYSVGESQKNIVLDSVLVEAKQKLAVEIGHAIEEAVGSQFEDTEIEILVKRLDECGANPTTIVQDGYVLSFACDAIKELLESVTLSKSEAAERICASLHKRLIRECDGMFEHCESTQDGIINVFLQRPLLGRSIDRPHALMRPVNIESCDPQASLACFMDVLDQPAYQDQHCECRSRGYNTFAYTHGNDGCSYELVVQPVSLFEQPGQYNTLAAQEVIPEKRKFAALPDGFVESAAVVAVIEQTMEGVADIRGDFVQFAKLGMHFIKIRAEGEGGVGTPVPEGRHQDGFDFVSITVLARQGIEGGLNIFAQSQAGDPFLSAMVQPGHGYVIDDRKLWHDVLPIRATGFGGSRCVLVVTVTVQTSEEPDGTRVASLSQPSS